MWIQGSSSATSALGWRHTQNFNFRSFGTQGHDTTTSALSFSCWCLAEHQDVQVGSSQLSTNSASCICLLMDRTVAVRVNYTQLICGNKMPTRCNRGFYCRSYCLLNIFRAPRCPSSGGQEYYTVVATCGISCSGFQVAGLVWSWGLCCSILQTGHITLSSTPDQQLENHCTKYHR